MRYTRALRSPVSLCAALVMGCGGDEEPASTGGDCLAPNRIGDDGRCVEPGVQSNGCPAGTLGLEDGSCQPAGIPPQLCTEPFLLDDAQACKPILPEAPCPLGMMAVPGDAECREVAPCGSDTWGDIPVAPDTQYVDQSYGGGGSDGTATKPWTTITEAVDAASSGAIVALAEGSYPGGVTLSDKAIHLWGRCPAMVEIVASGGGPAALLITTGAAGTSVHNLALRGSGVGLALSGSTGVTAERLWVHDNVGQGINTEDAIGPAELTVRHCLVEQNSAMGLFVRGAELTVESSVVRDTATTSQGLYGRGIGIQNNPATGAAATLTLSNSLLERNHDLGVFVGASTVTVTDTVIRDTFPDAEGSGWGIGVQPDPTTGAPSSLVMHRGFIERNESHGVYLQGSTATLEATTVRATLPDGTGYWGRGVGVEPDELTGAPASLVLGNSLIEQNSDIGVFVHRSLATIEATLVRDTQVNAAQIFGRAIHAQFGAATGEPITLNLRFSAIERSRQTGAAIIDTQAAVEASLLLDNLEDPFGNLGDGIVVYSVNTPAAATIVATRVERSSRAAIANFGGQVALGASWLACQAIDLDGEPSGAYDFSFDDRSGNACGCDGTTSECAVVSANLTPPSAVGGLE